MADAETLLEELHELVNGQAFLQADYDAILTRIQTLEVDEDEERLTPAQVEKLRMLRARF